MLTVTNAINPHYLPLHLRPDARNNQHPANMTNVQALTMPVIPPQQRFFDATFSRFFNPSSNPTTNTFSPIVAQRHRIEAQLQPPAVYVPTSFTQKTVEIDTALHYHYNSKISTQMDLFNHPENMSKTSSPEQRQLITGYTKPKECIFQDFVPCSSAVVSSIPTSSPNTIAPLLQNIQHTDRTLSVASIPSLHLTSKTIFPSHPNLPSQHNFPSSSTNKTVNKGNSHKEISLDIKTNYSKRILNNENIYNDNLIWNSGTEEEDQGYTFGAEGETKLVEIKSNEIKSGTTVLDNNRYDNKSLCEDSVTVDDLKVKSLRHSIESILNMQTSFRGRNSEVTRKNKDRNEEYAKSIIKEENPDERWEMFDEDKNDNFQQNNSYEIKDEEEIVDGDYDNAISVSSTGNNENISDDEIHDPGKEDQDVDVISCNERISSPLSSSEEEVNLRPVHSSILENNSLNNHNQGIQQTNEDILQVPMELDDDVTTKVSFGHTSEKDHITTDFDPGNTRHQRNNIEKSSKNISEHLKRIEGLITKQNADHFQKDEFFQAKMQILRSVTKDCMITADGQQVVNQQLNREERYSTNDVGHNNCNLMSSVSKLPPFHSLLPTDYVPNIRPCPPLCPCRQNPHHHIRNQYPHPFPARERQTILQRTEQIQDEGHRNLFESFEEESQKSAFKPIIKKALSSQLTSMQSLCQSKTGTGAEQIDPIGSSVHRSSIGYPETVFNPSNDDTQLRNSPSAVSKEHSLDDSINLDAISLLRLRSNSYQCPGSLPASFSYSSTSRPNPEAFRAWLTWLRARNPDVLVNNSIQQNMPSILSKVPAPPRYHCGDCNKTYSTFGGLSKHRQFHCALHVKKEFACKICTKSYSSLGALKMHIRTHTLPCKCHICGKAFSRPWLLQGHVRTHTGEKPFRCNHCGRAFADRSNLRAHLQTHAEIKKYACVKCGKTFSRMSLLTKHSDGSCPANTSPCV